MAKSKAAMTSETDLEDFLRLQDELDAARQQMTAISKAEVYLKESSSTIENLWYR